MVSSTSSTSMGFSPISWRQTDLQSLAYCGLPELHAARGPKIAVSGFARQAACEQQLAAPLLCCSHGAACAGWQPEQDMLDLRPQHRMKSLVQL